MITEETLVDVGYIELLPDTEAILSGASIREMLPDLYQYSLGRPELGQTKGLPRNPKHYSIYYSEEEIAKNKILDLSPREYRVLRLHLQGMRRCDIARIIGITEVGVGVILGRPRVKAVKAEKLVDLEDDISALQLKALNAYRTGLDNPDVEIQMKAADRVFKVSGKESKTQTKNTATASQLVSQVMQKFEQNITVNVQQNELKAIDE